MSVVRVSPPSQFASLFALALFCACVTQVRAANAFYFALQPVAMPVGAPSTLLVQSPSYINVPAGAVLKVHLLLNDQVLATSRLDFSAAYSAAAQFPPVSVASFVQAGASTSGGQVLPGAALQGGSVDLAAVAANPAQYRFLWTLSAGTMGVPGQAIFSGGGFGLTTVKLSALSAAVRPYVEKPGSLLIYPYYTSSLSSTSENTTITLTNTSATDATQVRVLFYSAADCQTAEYAVCLGAQQTFSFQTGDYDPGVKGYAIAYATDASGQPAQFNYLVGSERLKQPGAGGVFDVTLDALTVMKRNDGVVAAVNGTADLAFDDVTYDRLPSQLTLDTLPSQVSGQNATTLVLTRLSSTATDERLTVVNATGDKTALSTQKGVTCQTQVKLGSLRLSPTLSTLVPADATGWMKVSAADDGPILGLYLSTGRANTGGNLRATAYADSFHLTVPVKAVACQ